MFTVRATRRLQAQLQVRPVADPPPPTTRLGDWYANQVELPSGDFILCVSERTFLPVLLPASALPRLPAALANALQPLLEGLGVHPTQIASEQEAMADVGYGRTNNRHVVGFMNEFAFMATERLSAPRPRLLEISRWLAGTPCRMCFPDRATREAFGVAKEGRG